MGGWGSVVIGGVWRGATVAEIAMVDNGEMRTANQVEALFGQRTSVGGFEKVSISPRMIQPQFGGTDRL